jgi:hypothetical protein
MLKQRAALFCCLNLDKCSNHCYAVRLGAEGAVGASPVDAKEQAFVAVGGAVPAAAVLVEEEALSAPEAAMVPVSPLDEGEALAEVEERVSRLGERAQDVPFAEEPNAVEERGAR